MEMRRYIVVLLMIGLVTPLAFAQPGAVAADEQYVPRLADIMSTVQLRHMKLWFAGKAPNWDLAAFELLRLKDRSGGSRVAVSGYTGDKRDDNGETHSGRCRCDRGKGHKVFASTFGELTVACNACHQSVGRGFVVMRVPTASPFSDQVFPPQAKP